MGTENKKRNKVHERDILEDRPLGDLDLPKKKKKKTKHCHNEDSIKSDNQTNIDLDVSNNTTSLVESNDIEPEHSHELCSDLIKQKKRSKKRKYIESFVQAENNYEIDLTGNSIELETNHSEISKLSSSKLKKKKHKSLAIDSDKNPPDLTYPDDILVTDSRIIDGKLSKANDRPSPEQNDGISITESEEIPLQKKKKDLNQCDNFSFNFKNDLSPSKEKSIGSKFNSNYSNIKLGSLLNPTYLQNKNIQNSNKFIKPNSDKSFIEAKLLKKEEQKSRYPEVQDDTIALSEGRLYTISIAIPASILEETCLLHELRTYVIGQLSRAASIFSVDEIIVYNDQCWRSPSNLQECIENYIGMMKMILEYQECPQYLRRDLFPMHPCMSKVGVLNALNAPHHLLSNQWCTYREGIVLDKNHGKVSFADVGLRYDVQIDRKLEPGIRVTVKFPPEVRGQKRLYGSVVSPHEPRIKGGLYWGYTVRVANSLPEVFKSDDFQDGYDLIIGTSDKGDNIFDAELESFKHALIVFGGVDGLEMAMEADETVKEKNPRNLFQYYLNCCPNQQSRTIRTEEAVVITLSSLSHKLKQYGSKKPS